jgi:hypothetical protein
LERLHAQALSQKGPAVCQSCVDIEQLRKSLRSTADFLEIERLNLAIAELYRERVRLHQNPQR